MGRRTLLLVLGCLLLLGVEALFLWHKAESIPFLADDSGALWIEADLPIRLEAQARGERLSGFARVFQATGPAPEVRLELRAYRSARLYLNGSPLDEASGAGAVRLSAELGHLLLQGENRLLVVVGNDSGPALLRAESTRPELRSDSQWLASADTKTWAPARPASSLAPADLSAGLTSPWDALRQRWPLWLALFAAGAAAAWAGGRLLAAAPAQQRAVAALRWLLLGALAALFAHNWAGVKRDIGMDLAQHLEYVEYILARGALPLGNEGWQMFQPPLAYGLNAAALGLARLAGYAPDPAYAGRALTMLVCLAAAWFALRSVEKAFIGRPAQQAAGLVVAASLPASIYMAHAFGNEPYFACLAAWAFYLVVGAAPPRDERPRLRHAAVLGLVCGLALLAKTSALLLGAVLAAVLVVESQRQQRAAALKEVALFAACAALVAGWWYLRNLIELGRPFVGGWEGGRGIDWWQYPGYRLPQHLLGFGAVFVQPVYAGLAGFWDSLWSSLWGDGYLSGITRLPRAPNWNLPVMASLYLLALPLALAVVAGTLRALLLAPDPPTGHATRISAALLLLFLAAMVHLYATVPIYSAAKGSYLMALAPCLGILAASGAGPLLRRRAGQAIVSGVSSLWLGAVGLAFLAQGGS